MHKDMADVHVTVGDGVVVLHRVGQSKRVIANVLGVERAVNGEIQTIWLDRLVHRRTENEFVDWLVSGAVSTIMTRKAKPTTN